MRERIAGALSRLMRLRAVELVAPIGATIVALVHRLSGRRAGLVVLFHLVSDRQGDFRRELVAPLERSLYERQLRLCAVSTTSCPWATSPPRWPLAAGADATR